jgi:uncharacterized HAD superfamily protein/hypoxanthine phosphoribosyltransferase
MSTFELEYRSYADLSGLIHSADISKLKNYDLVVGIPRSGMIPAYMLGLRLNIPVIDLEGFLNGNAPVTGSRMVKQVKDRFGRMLVVDDSIRSGKQLDLVKEKLSGMQDCEFGFCTPFATSDKTGQVDHYFELIDRPRVFQWNIMHSWIYGYSCVDIDGVLCDDPTAEENDDGENYIRFLLNAPLKFKPNVPVHTLVTNRLEKYRPQTEKWLSEQGIQYKELLMLDLPDRATRVRMGNYGAFKAEVYQSRKDTLLFIESDCHQASKINELTGRAVFCVDEMRFFPPLKPKTPVHRRVARKVKKYLRSI